MLTYNDENKTNHLTDLLESIDNRLSNLERDYAVCERECWNLKDEIEDSMIFGLKELMHHKFDEQEKKIEDIERTLDDFRLYKRLNIDRYGMQ